VSAKLTVACAFLVYWEVITRLLYASILVLPLAAACTNPPKSGGATHAGVTATDTNAATDAKNPGPPGEPIVVARFGNVEWRPPTEAEIPSDSLGSSIRRGLALLRHTTDSLPAYAPGNINCTNCHLQDGRALYGAPLAGSHARYPKYIPRTGAVVTLADRVNYCFTRSLAGNRLPSDSREMADILSYLAWISRGIPIGAKVPGSDGMPRMKEILVGDVARGASLYGAKCQVCHQENGGGNAIVPALWGQKSYAVGASMARLERAATFISHNMPLGQGGSLTAQEAFDLSAYVNSHARPDLPGKEKDFPFGGAPKDLPYSTTSGHKAVNAPPLLPRRTPARALVPAPFRAGINP
jgi:thiosulfate dehydrogenase